MSRRPYGMSYMFGDHCPSGLIKYTGDNRNGEALLTEQTAPPAWLVADWMIMRHDGQPLPPLCVTYCDAPTDNKMLLWLRDYLR